MQWIAGALILILVLTSGLQGQVCPSKPLAPQLDWPVYGGQAEGDHYSSLTQINEVQD